ncbi:MAG: PDZ domain-containing protein, partial [Verrucomicrobiales bacterium]
GIGFSIPANEARRTFEHILAKGRPVYGYLGLLQVEDLNNRFRSVLNYQGKGVVVIDVVVGSPAEKAGLQPYDIITAYNGQGVESAQSLLTRVQRSPIGEEVPISIVRGGQTHNLSATIGEHDPQNQQENGAGSRVASDQTILRLVGLGVQNIALRYRSRGYRGVVVSQVLPGSLAEEVGFRKGDHLLTVNRERIVDRDDFYLRLVSSAGVQETTITFLRNQRPHQLTIPPVPRSSATD